MAFLFRKSISVTKTGWFCTITCLYLLLTISGCKKIVDKIKTDAIVDVMVANPWVIQQYTDGPNDVTTEFNGYEFQFSRNYTVLGTNGTISQSGTWSGDASAGTITANFPAGTAPVTRLNGKWTVYTYDRNGPKFNQFINGVEMKLILKKK